MIDFQRRRPGNCALAGLALHRGRLVRYRLLQAVAAVVLVVGSLGAGCDFAGGSTQPLTDSVTVGVINTTPYRAIFTIGAWEPLDRESLPQFFNVRLESQENATDGHEGAYTMRTAVLSSGTATLGCRRAISIGSADLVRQINNKEDILVQVEPAYEITDEEAMITGVNFSDAAADSPDAANPTVGTAEPVVVEHGVDYPCGSVVIFTLVEDPEAEGGFRIDAGTIY